MRCLPFLVCALLLGLPAHASGAGTGGTAAPSSGGGVSFGQPLEPVPKVLPRPVARAFSVAPATLAPGAVVRFAYRVDAPFARVRAHVVLRRRGARAIVVRLGRVRTRRPGEYRWTPARGQLRPGRYAVALHVADRRGRDLERTPRASGRGRLRVAAPPPPPPAPPPETVTPPVIESVPGVFPIAGPYSFGGADARFGAGRPGHIHQGQDISAANGLPLVAPVAATVFWVAHQRGGAGHYVVLRGGDGRDYVFMHLRRGSISVAPGAALAAGQSFGQVGNSGSSSGPHLHFELWPDGWYATRQSRPVDPLPQLQAWAAAG